MKKEQDKKGSVYKSELLREILEATAFSDRYDVVIFKVEKFVSIEDDTDMYEYVGIGYEATIPNDDSEIGEYARLIISTGEMTDKIKEVLGRCEVYRSKSDKPMILIGADSVDDIKELLKFHKRHLLKSLYIEYDDNFEDYKVINTSRIKDNWIDSLGKNKKESDSKDYIEAGKSSCIASREVNDVLISRDMKTILDKVKKGDDMLPVLKATTKGYCSKIAENGADYIIKEIETSCGETVSKVCKVLLDSLFDK